MLCVVYVSLLVVVISCLLVWNGWLVGRFVAHRKLDRRMIPSLSRTPLIGPRKRISCTHHPLHASSPACFMSTSFIHRMLPHCIRSFTYLF